jgi:hypothetical protein
MLSVSPAQLAAAARRIESPSRSACATRPVDADADVPYCRSRAHMSYVRICSRLVHASKSAASKTMGEGILYQHHISILTKEPW